MDLLRPFRRVSAAATTPAPASGSVDTYTIAHRFNSDHDYDFFCVSVRVDPDELWAEDWDGDLWVIPYSTDGADDVTWGEFQRARLVAVPVEASTGVQANQLVGRTRQRVLATFTRPETRPTHTTPAAAAASTQEEPTIMDVDTSLLRRRLGLSDDATEEQITEALATEPESPEAERTPGSEVPTGPETPTAEVVETPEPVAAAEDRTVTVDRDQWEQVQRDAQAGATAARAQQAAELDQLVDAAVRDGRIAPSSRDGWRQAIDPGDQPDAPATARAAAEQQRLSGLATNRVPVNERAAAPDPQAHANSSSLRRALAAVGANREGRPSGQGEVIRRG